MTFADVILLRGAIFAFSCCSSRRQNCWELFLMESSRKLSKQNRGAGEFSTNLIYIFYLSILNSLISICLSSLIPPRKRQNKTLTETINKSRRRCGRGVNTFDLIFQSQKRTLWLFSDGKKLHKLKKFCKVRLRFFSK